MQTGFKRSLANILKNEVKRGPLVHVNDVWPIVYYYEENNAALLRLILESSRTSRAPFSISVPLIEEVVVDEDPQIRNPPSEEQSRLETLAYLVRCEVLSQEEYKKMRTFNSSEVDMLGGLKIVFEPNSDNDLQSENIQSNQLE